MKKEILLLSLVLVLMFAGCTQQDTIEPEIVESNTDEIKGSAVDVSYDELMRNSGEYKGEMVYIRGEVLQYIEAEGEDNIHILRVSVTKEGDEYFEYWTDPVYVEYEGDIVLVKDIVDIWGVSEGTITYEDALGIPTTIPGIRVLRIEVVTKAGDR